MFTKLFAKSYTPILKQLDSASMLSTPVIPEAGQALSIALMAKQGRILSSDAYKFIEKFKINQSKIDKYHKHLDGHNGLWTELTYDDYEDRFGHEGFDVGILTTRNLDEIHDGKIYQTLWVRGNPLQARQTKAEAGLEVATLPRFLSFCPIIVTLDLESFKNDQIEIEKISEKKNHNIKSIFSSLSRYMSCHTTEGTEMLIKIFSEGREMREDLILDFFTQLAVDSSLITHCRHLYRL